LRQRPAEALELARRNWAQGTARTPGRPSAAGSGARRRPTGRGARGAGLAGARQAGRPSSGRVEPALAGVRRHEALIFPKPENCPWRAPETRDAGTVRVGGWFVTLTLLITLCVLLFGSDSPTPSPTNPATATLRLTPRDGGWDARWDIALRDLEYAIGLDGNGDGAITWGELRARESAVTRLRPGPSDAAGRSCALRRAARFATAGRRAQRRRLCDARLRSGLSGGRRAQRTRLSAVLRARSLAPRFAAGGRADRNGNRRVIAGTAATLAERGARQRLAAVRELLERRGAAHLDRLRPHPVFAGPAAAGRAVAGKRPLAAGGTALRTVLLETAGIVTAFTLAHSLTLTLAVLDVVDLPSRLVETAIAFTIVLAALNNLFPLVTTRRWSLAFGLGLIHGFGFASALRDLGLPSDALALALAGFNLGCRNRATGHCRGIALPLAFVLRQTWLYRRLALPVGSAAVALLALVWCLERGLNINLLPASAARGATTSTPILPVSSLDFHRPSPQSNPS
jgi:hypothetical protein